MPFVVFEKKDKQQQNSYNCPIVSGYSEVIKSVQEENIPIDAPTITFKDEALLYKQCNEYLKSLGIRDEVCKMPSHAHYRNNMLEEKIAAYNQEVLNEGRKKHKLIILLAGRPYHSDPLIQHKVSDMIAAMGVYVITDDIVRQQEISLEKNPLPLSMGIYQPYS